MKPADVVITFDDGTFIHLGPRTAGGPGSGNFGHAGRPGKVGGSSKAAPAASVAPETPPASPSDVGRDVPYAEFRDRLTAKGYRVKTPTELPDDVRKHTKIQEASSPMNEAMVLGIEKGLDDIERSSPELAEALKSNVEFVYGRYEPEANATSVIGPSQGWILINDRERSMQGLDRAFKEDPNFNIALKRSKDLPPGIERTTEFMRGVTIHEVGHVADHLTGNSLALHVVSAGVDAAITDPEASFFAKMGVINDDQSSALITYFSKEVSGYAGAGGPKEAAAEVFTAAILGHPLPSAFDEMVKGIKTLGAKP